MLREFLVSVILTGMAASLMAQQAPQRASATTLPSGAAGGSGGAADAEDPFRTREAGAPTERVKSDELLRLTVVNDMLVTETTLRPGGPQLVAAEGLSAPVSVTIRHRSKAPERWYVPDSIDMDMLQRDGDRIVTTSLKTTPGRVNFARSIETSGGEYMIQFLQNPATTQEPAKTSLFVQALHEPEAKATLVSESFSAFARSHPAELTQNVRPMLEAFGPQPHLFAVSDELGAAVFPEVYRADAATQQRIAVLVKQLGDESFAKRKQAGEELEKLGTQAGTELALLDRAKLDPEQGARVDAILTKTRPPFTVEANKLRSDVGFLLDCLMSQTPQLRKVALERLQKVTGQTVAFDDGASEEQRVQQVYKLRGQLLPASPATMPAKQSR